MQLCTHVWVKGLESLYIGVFILHIIIIFYIWNWSINLLWLSLGSQEITSQCSIVERMLNSVFLCTFTCARGAKYSLLAYTTLCLPEAEGSFQSHSLIVLQNGKKQSHRNVISADIKGLCFLSPHLIQCYSNDTIFFTKMKDTIKENNPWSSAWITFLFLREIKWIRKCVLKLSRFKFRSKHLVWIGISSLMCVFFKV